jgi:branched-chain amino acid transport system substrate-binding protein
MRAWHRLPGRVRAAACRGFRRRFDLGGLEVSYGPGDHSGLDFADLSIIGSDGRFRR